MRKTDKKTGQIALTFFILITGLLATCDLVEPTPALIPTENAEFEVFVPVVSVLTATPFQPSSGRGESGYPAPENPSTTGGGVGAPLSGSNPNLNLWISPNLPSDVAGSLTLPIRGRIAIVIYLTIGDAQPRLEISDMVLELYNEKPRPVILVANTGNAHGRTAGFVEAVDATGKRFDFEITPLPILPGQTRRIPLYQPTIDDRTPQDFAVPLEISGSLEWGSGKTKIEQRVLTMP